MSVGTTTLGRVLETCRKLPWDHALYLPENERWSLETRCLVLDPDASEDGEDEPAEAKAEGLVYALDMQSVRGVVDNAQQQRPTANLDDLLRALLYYYDNDAFAQL